ncbi:MAG: PTS sugar transporter subunit IIA [Lysobacterales bacterium]|jgi:mannose/fructose-specific phosphotransferase system component IIA
MSVGIVLVTHGSTGSDLIESAEFILGQRMESVRVVPFNQSESHCAGIGEVREAIESAGDGDGVLVLTDLFGASPCNLVADQLEHYQAVMVTGLNLAMLMSVWNYRDQPLGALARKAVDSGRRSMKIVQK